MLDLLLRPYRAWFNFSGRAQRAEFWLFQLTIIIVLIFFYASPLALLLSSAMLVFFPYFFAVIASLSVTIRRLHDTNRSGWWYLISFIPVIGSIWFFVLMVLNGTKGKNRFGPDPKRR